MCMQKLDDKTVKVCNDGLSNTTISLVINFKLKSNITYNDFLNMSITSTRLN